MAPKVVREPHKLLTGTLDFISHLAGFLVEEASNFHWWDIPSHTLLQKPDSHSLAHRKKVPSHSLPTSSTCWLLFHPELEITGGPISLGNTLLFLPPTRWRLSAWDRTVAGISWGLSCSILNSTLWEHQEFSINLDLGGVILQGPRQEWSILKLHQKSKCSKKNPNVQFSRTIGGRFCWYVEGISTNSPRVIDVPQFQEASVICDPKMSIFQWKKKILKASSLGTSSTGMWWRQIETCFVNFRAFSKWGHGRPQEEDTNFSANQGK